MATYITPEDANRLSKPTDGFLCPLSANTFGIDFLNFTISDYISKKTIFEVGRDNPAPPDVSVDFSSIGEDMYRKIKYTFSEDVLRLPNIQTTLVFSVGNKEVRDFRMIERHYFKNQLVKSFDFSFGFCIPGSVNSWEAIYDLPPLSEQLITDMIDNPYDTKSDSFYFVDGKLIMHNKAAYKYIREDAAQAKKSYEDKYQSKTSKASKPTRAAKEVYLEDGTAAPEDAEAKVAEAKDGVAAISLRGGAKPSSSAKEPQWSKESDYF